MVKNIKAQHDIVLGWGIDQRIRFVKRFEYCYPKPTQIKEGINSHKVILFTSATPTGGINHEAEAGREKGKYGEKIVGRSNDLYGGDAL